MTDNKNGFFELANKGRNDWFLYVITFLLVAAGYILGQVPLTALQMYKVEKNNLGIEALNEFEKTLDFSIFGIDKNLGFVFLIAMFIFATIGLYAGLRLHKKKFIDIITPQRTINFKKILFAFGFWFLLNLVLETVTYFIDPSHYTFTFNAGSFFILLLICIFLLPIQTSFEEFVFRGYMMPSLSLLIRNKWMPLLISSVLFSLVHSANPEIEKYGFWTMQFYYIGAGLFLGYITIMDDSLELALGVHAATNIFGAAIVSYDGSVLQTDTLAKTSIINPWMMIAFFYISSAIFIYVCHKRYKWSGLEVLLAPVNFHTNSDDRTISNFDSDEQSIAPLNDNANISSIKKSNINPADSSGFISNTDYTSLINENEEE